MVVAHAAPLLDRDLLSESRWVLVRAAQYNNEAEASPTERASRPLRLVPHVMSNAETTTATRTNMFPTLLGSPTHITTMSTT